jgi:hypothetical protein
VEEGAIKRFERDATTLSTLNPDHEPVKGFISPHLDSVEKITFSATGSQPNEIRVGTSGNPQFPDSRIGTSGNPPGTAASGEMENHFRTTTNFARNTMYRKFNGAIVPNVTSENFEPDRYITEDSGFDSTSYAGGYSNGGRRKSVTPLQTHARNKTDNNRSFGVDEGYTSKLLMPKLQTKDDKLFNSMRAPKNNFRPPSNSKASQQSKLLVLRDYSHNHSPLLNYPKTNSSKGSRGLNNSFL